MFVCTGKGDRGDHCCYIAGEICEFLFINRGGVPRCQLFEYWGRLDDSTAWHDSPVGRWFARHYPGFDCRDWPQNIPEVMANTKNLCCWSDS